MDIRNLVYANFMDSIRAKEEAMAVLPEIVVNATNCMVQTFRDGGKVLICGNGGSASDSQHFAAEFTGRYEMERGPLPAIALTTDTSALTAIGNDYSFDVVFSKQVEALGKPGDVLFAISTSGNSGNVIKAIECAHAKGMHVIALTGRGGGKMSAVLKDGDIHICVPATRTARIQEIHILVLHALCDAIDTVLFKIS